VDRVDVEQTAAALRALLADVDAGELGCSAGLRNRIDGAAVTLEQIAPGSPTNDR